MVKRTKSTTRAEADMASPTDMASITIDIPLRKAKNKDSSPNPSSPSTFREPPSSPCLVENLRQDVEGLKQSLATVTSEVSRLRKQDDARRRIKERVIRYEGTV